MMRWRKMKGGKKLKKSLYNPTLWVVFTGVSGKGLTLQQISVHVNTCG